ncbi:MAG: UDP-3-O-(3-hydroxymyristoyl)glucosamine N-acyltransferase [Sedimentisphaerales bacterium]|nr:UDP-3-O-(3-hydroxymyristoyl)glucosamine N-acyltransferase [Sedimentisphaerales bacterium]MBN2841571.1 UDP-3-O-(3-hydroxymyristoyl)glucosamine N-acyltransferase [Sedimentisphaerales bacterium]
MLLSQIAEKLGSAYNGADQEINSINSLENAIAGEISFLSDKSYANQLGTTSASVVVVPDSMANIACKAIILSVIDIDQALDILLDLFAPEIETERPGRHHTAIIAPDVRLGEGVAIGAHAVIEKGAEIGAGTVISAGCIIGQNVRIGRNCLLLPNVVVFHSCVIGDNVEIHSNSTIGSAGFGYKFDKGNYKRIRHIGNVIIENDVEIGANTCIDRAKFGSTVIGSGSKIDNLVQIAHNVKVGKNCIIAGQVGIAGSTKIGNFVIMGGQVGIADHCVIGDQAQFGARTAMVKGQHVKAGVKLMGIPAQNKNDELKQIALVRKLPELFRELKKANDSKK